MSESARERPCGICGAIERIRAGGAECVAELARSYVVLGDAQFYRGYCILLAKQHATELFHMRAYEAHQLFDELLQVSEAIAEVAKPQKLNYECLGNLEPHVHWHIFPRFASDPMPGPVWLRSEQERSVELSDHDRRTLIAELRDAICRRIPDARVPG